MTLDLPRLRVLLEKATKGPWQVSGGRQSSVKLGRNAQVHHIGPDGVGVAAVYYELDTGLGFADANLIVALVNAAPDLMAAAEEKDRLREENDRLRALKAAPGSHEALIEAGNSAAARLRKTFGSQPKDHPND